MDFGAMMGPQLTKINNKFAVQITRNDQYQCFVGIGVCHPNIVRSSQKKNIIDLKNKIKKV